VKDERYPGHRRSAPRRSPSPPGRTACTGLGRHRCRPSLSHTDPWVASSRRARALRRPHRVRPLVIRAELKPHPATMLSAVAS
jgi:hypothetical protein